MRLRCINFLFALVLLSTPFRALASSSEQYLIRPGISIGGVTIGMGTRDPRLTRIHAPTRTIRMAHGIIVETWLSSAPVPPHIISDKSLLANYLTLFFKGGKVVEIEVSSEGFHTKSGLSTANPATDFEKIFTHFRGGEYERLIMDDPTYSLPAAKHFVAYEDSIASGLAWKYGTWGNMGPEPDPSQPLESLIVHLKGMPVIFDPSDSLPYSGTWPKTK